MREVLFLGLSLLVMSCSPLPEEGEGLDVVVGIPPLEYFVERVGGEWVQTHLLIKPGENPHTFEPNPRQIMEVSQADLFLRMDMPFENMILEKLELKEDLLVVDVTEGMEKKDFEAHDEHEGHEHEEDLDPHVWLAPPLIKTMAIHIANVLKERDPANQEEYEKNVQAFLEEVEEVHEKIQQRLRPYEGERFYVYHSAFGYFGETYGLEQVYLEIEGKSFTTRQLDEYIRTAKEENVRILFVQPQFDTKSAEAIASAIDGAVVSIDPLREDVLTNLLEMAEEIERSFQR